MIELEVVEVDPLIEMDAEQVRLIFENDYERLINQPQINHVTLIGNKMPEDLGLEPETEVISMLDIYKIFNRTIA